MRVNFGAKPWVFPMPVLIVGTYDENGVPNAMKAGFISGENICIDGGMTKLMIYHGEHGWKYEE